MMRRFVVAALALGMAVSAQAKIFRVTWSGAQFENGASAVGLFDINTSLYPELGGVQNNITLGPDFTILSVRVQGSAGGNGVFGQGDFSSAYFAAFSPLNYNQELIGQAMTNGFNFGSFGDGYGGGSGDFNLFSASSGSNIGSLAAPNPDAPNGTFFFELTTAGGDRMAVTSIAPGTVPEPASWAMLLAGFGLTGAAMRRRRKTVAA